MTLARNTFDIDSFRIWLGKATGEVDIEVTAIRGGASCDMFRVDRPGPSWMVRRAPLNAVTDTAHQVIREARIIEELSRTDVPVPSLVARCEDPTVIGAPFFVMSCIEGEVVRRNGLPEAFAAQPDSHSVIGEQLIDTLVKLHAVPWRETGLADLSRPEGFLARQVDRWMTQLSAYRFRELDGLDDIAAWLDANLPPTGDLTVMHGDYKLDNVMWAPAPPPRIVSVVDFEMTTVGDPLIDLAWALMFWPGDDNPIALAAPGSPNGIAPHACQTPGQLMARYCDATGRDITHFDWYQAFSAWKLAIVLEASYAKHCRGESTNPSHEAFGFVVDHLLQRAQRFTR
jgi:aminoglycoside phosphotransferase (APT) family kinase protein